MEDKQFKELINKLDILIKLNAINIIKDKKYREQVKILSSYGFKPNEIAEILGKTSHEIRNVIYRLRKK